MTSASTRTCRAFPLILTVVVVAAGASLRTSASSPPARSSTSAVRAAARSLASDAPLLFEENRGQVSAEVKYLVRARGYALFLTPREPVWMLRAAGGGEGGTATMVRMELQGMNPNARLYAEEPARTRTSYLRGSDPGGWVSGLLNHSRIRYRDVYPNIDLVFYGDGHGLEYDFVVGPGADPSQIRFRFEGVDDTHLRQDGSLLLSTGHGNLEHSVPRIYQVVDGARRSVPGGFQMDEGDTVRFAVEAFDRERELVIDPVLRYSTYFGGTRDEVPGAVAVDADGNLYVVGSTGSLDFPTVDPAQPEFGGGGTPNGDVFITKLDPTGSFVIYSTYIGGTGTDIGRSIAVDAQGRAVVTGTTFSANFPATPGAFQTVCSGQCPFVVKLSPDGSQFVYSTFLGRGDGVAVSVDSNSRALVTGRTTSSDFPVANAFQAERGGQSDAFVSSLNATGTALVFSTFLGGSADENLTGRQGITSDAAGNIFVVGHTVSDDFPVLNPAQATRSGAEDAFVSKFTAQGNLVYSSYLGGTGQDRGQAVAVDPQGNLFVAGNTTSADFPTANAFQPDYGGGAGIGDAFVAKFSPAGNQLLFSTYLGGQAGDTANDIAIDSLGRVVIVGNASANFPVVDPFVQFSGIRNYVAKLSNDGSELIYSTPIGGADADIAVAAFGTDVYVAGNIATGTLPLLKPLQALRKGGIDTFLVQVADAGELYFAHFGNGTGAVSDILLTNSSEASPANALVQFRGDDGLPVELNLSVVGDPGIVGPQNQVDQLNVVVAPMGAVRIRTDGLGDIVTGSVTVTHDNPLGGVIRFNLSPFGNAGVGTSGLVRGFISPVRRTTINTGVAVYNPLDRQVGLRFRLRNLAGVQVTGGLRNLTLQPHEHLARFITELFQNADLAGFEGTVTVEVTSLDAVITGTALELGPQPGQFTTLPVTPIP